MAQTERSMHKPTPCETSGEAFFTRMRDRSEHLEHEIKKHAETMDHYIKKNPVKSTIIAGVVGLILGKFLAR